jgi:hypothetical protein
MANTTVKLTTEVNRYDYKVYGLFIPYALANVFAVICVTLGLTSYVRDGAMPGKKMQDLVQAARNPMFHNSPDLGSRTTSLGAGVGPDGAMEMRIASGDPGEGSSDGRHKSWQSIRWSSDMGKARGESLV